LRHELEGGVPEDDPDLIKALEAEGTISELEETLNRLEAQAEDCERQCNNLEKQLNEQVKQRQEFENLRDASKVNVDLKKIVVVDGLPVGVPEKKHEKLVGFVWGFFIKGKKTKSGIKFVRPSLLEVKIQGEKLLSFELALDKDGKTAGCGFARFEDAKSAAEAAKVNNNKVWVKGKKFITNILADVQKYQKVDAVFKPLRKPEVKERPNFLSWLQDKHELLLARDTFEKKELWPSSEMRIDEISVNAIRPAAPKYAILDQLDQYRGVDSKFEFKLVWPGTDIHPMHWRQSSNPLELGETDPVEGFEPISCPHEDKKLVFQGIRADATKSKYLLKGDLKTKDGEESSENWFCLGRRSMDESGLKGPFGRHVMTVELHVVYPKTRDQFVVRYEEETQVFWNDPLEKKKEQCRELVYGGEREKAQGQKKGRKKHWTQGLVQWSPKGAYLATFHLQGIAIWGGPDFIRVGRFEHPNVSEVAFSPDEHYLVTCNYARKDAIIIWDIESEKKMRTFDCRPNDGWPIFSWSSDEKYVCRVDQKRIFVYQVPSMVLLDKKPLAHKGVQTALFSPSDNLIAAYLPDSNGTPASLVIIEIPSQKVVRKRHFHSVNSLWLHWHPQGDFLCAKLNRQATRKTTVHSFEIFRMRSKSIPVETMEMKDVVVDFAWEPNGNYFAVSHGPLDQKRNSGRTSVDIYTLANGRLKILKTFENRMCNKLYWAPRQKQLHKYGRTLLLTGLGDMNGMLEFIDVNTLQSTSSSEHLNCTDVCWDPSGRYVITAVTQRINDDRIGSGMNNGYRLWDAHGTQLAEISQSKFYCCLWRPRPAVLLEEKEIKQLEKDFDNKYMKIFSEIDSTIELNQLEGAEKQLREMREEWKRYRARCRLEHRQEALERAKVIGEPMEEIIEVTVETILSVSEEIFDPEE